MFDILLNGASNVSTAFTRITVDFGDRAITELKGLLGNTRGDVRLVGFGVSGLPMTSGNVTNPAMYLQIRQAFTNNSVFKCTYQMNPIAPQYSTPLDGVVLFAPTGPSYSTNDVIFPGRLENFSGQTQLDVRVLNVDGTSATFSLLWLRFEEFNLTTVN